MEEEIKEDKEKIEHCTQCNDKLYCFDIVSKSIFWFCVNPRCPTFGLVQMGMKTLEDFMNKNSRVSRGRN